MHLDKDIFLKIVDTTPFVSIDLIVRNETGQVLLGYGRMKKRRTRSNDLHALN
jgi:hypothetical protein